MGVLTVDVLLSGLMSVVTVEMSAVLLMVLPFSVPAAT